MERIQFPLQRGKPREIHIQCIGRVKCAGAGNKHGRNIGQNEGRCGEGKNESGKTGKTGKELVKTDNKPLNFYIRGSKYKKIERKEKQIRRAKILKRDKKGEGKQMTRCYKEIRNK